jgi:hypothetical protein
MRRDETFSRRRYGDETFSRRRYGDDDIKKQADGLGCPPP